MQGFSDETIRAGIEAMARELLEASGFRGNLAPEASLTEMGMLSVDMVNLMLAVESRFDIMIPGEFLTPEHFRSISSIERMVAGLLGGQDLAKVA